MTMGKGSLTPMQILIIEDDAGIADFVGKELSSLGHVVSVERSGKGGMMRAASEAFDLLILDRMLPDMDGLKLLSVLRATGDETPVLILSALCDVDDRVKGLRGGADDYLSKPFALSELVARVDVLSRRNQARGPATSNIVRLADLEVDRVGRSVRRSGRTVAVTRREFMILDYLLQNCGRIVTRSMILEQVWDYNFDPQTNIVDQHVSRLRNKLELPGESRLIHTVRGAGYIMRAD